MTKRFYLIIGFIFHLYQTTIAQGLVINEIMQSNIDMFMYENEYPESWFELYNPTNKDIALANYRISNVDDYSKSRALSDTIRAYGYKVIACDVSWSKGHAAFRLASDTPGGLYLYKGTKKIDQLSYNSMLAPGIAFARIGDGGSSWGYEVLPTPGAANDSPFSNILLDDPIFSIKGGLFKSLAKLDITIPDGNWPNDTRIYLTTDGSEPTFASQNAESFSLNLDATTVIRAKLMSREALSPRSLTQSYIFLGRDVDMYVFSLVTDSVHLYGNSTGIITKYNANWRRPLNVECFDPVANKVLFNQLGETALSGGGSRKFAQKSMKCYAKKWFGNNRYRGVFWQDKPNVSENKSFLLRNGGNNCTTTKINDAFVQKLFGIHVSNLDWQAYRPAIVFINGVYKGLFEMRERSNDDYVFSNYDGLESIVVAAANHYTSNTPPDRFQVLRKAYCAENTTYSRLDSLMDIDNFLKALISEMYSSNTDYPLNNVSMWCPTASNGKWRWILKDLDYMALNDVSHNMFTRMFKSYNGSLSYSNGTVTPGNYTIYRKLISYPEFRNSFINHYTVYLGDFLKPTVSTKLLDEMMNEIKAELSKTRNVYDDAKGYTSSWNRIKNYCNQRPAVVYSQMADFFSLGNVIPMKIINNGHGILVDSIPLTEGNFEGAYYSNYPLSLKISARNYGWHMVVFNAGTSSSYDFNAPTVSLTLNDYGSMDSIRFEPIQLNVSEFEQRLLDLGINSDDVEDHSSSSTIILPEPNCAYANITGIDGLPIDRTDYKQAYLEFYDNDGNYFKKRIILSVQGNSNFNQFKKNLSISFCDDEWEGEITPDLYFGDWVKQDEFHLKAFYGDYFRGIPAIGYKLYNQMVRSHKQDAYAWQRAFTEVDYSNTDLNIFEEARCFPDAFPCVIYFNGDYYGTYSWQLKKQRRNMNQTKNIATHIHLDGTLNDKQLFQGSINWNKFEVRNPNDLYNYDGTDYDGDDPKELIDASSPAYTGKKKMIRCAEVKQHIIELSNYYTELNALIEAGASNDEIRSEISARFDITSLIDYMILSLVTSNYNGFSKNWQWFTYDGKKWFVAPYDLDLTFGYNEDYSSLWTAKKSSKKGDFKMEDVDTHGPMTWIKNYFWDDLEKRYYSLRDEGIISTSNIMTLISDWYARIGEFNYIEEWYKWPQSPCLVNFTDSPERIRQWISERISLEDSYLGYHADSITYDLNMSDSEWATLCVPFAFDIPSDLSVYSVIGMDDDGVTLMLNQEFETVANTPYLVNSRSSNISLSGELVPTYSNLTNGILTGTLADVYAPFGSYVLQKLNDNTGFYRVNQDNYIKVLANKAYLTISTTTTPDYLRIPDNSQGIEDVQIDEVNNIDNSYYDYSGRRLSHKPLSGLFIEHNSNGTSRLIIKK